MLLRFPLRRQPHLAGKGNYLKSVLQNTFENFLQLRRTQNLRSSVKCRIGAPVRAFDWVRQLSSAQCKQHTIQLPAVAVHFEIFDDPSTHFFAFTLPVGTGDFLASSPFSVKRK